jgi:hypothetical protein
MFTPLTEPEGEVIDVRRVEDRELAFDNRDRGRDRSWRRGRTGAGGLVDARQAAGRVHADDRPERRAQRRGDLDPRRCVHPERRLGCRGNWSTPVAISAGAFSGQVLINMDGSGNAIAVWAGTRATSPLATASLAANSTTWTSMKTLAPAGTGSLGLATNSSGGVVIGFRTNTPDRIEAISGTILGGFGQPVVVGTAYGTAVRPTEVALNDAGVAVMGWVTDDFAKVVTRTPAGTWSAATQLAGMNAEGIGVAVDAAGNAVAGFGQDQGTFGVTAVYASKLPAGGAWGPATLLSTLNAKGKVAVGGDPAGTVVVSWMDSAGNIEALTIPPGGGFGAGTVVGAGPFTQLTVFPGQAVLVIGAGIAKETVN